MAKLNTNTALRQSEYKDDPRFSEIAKWAAFQEFASSEDMMKLVRAQFPITPKIELGKPAPYTTFFPTDIPVESASLDQLKLALSIPPAISGAAMPDLHPGYSMPIGGVVALDNAISPSYVGLDIGCRMHASIYDIDPGFLADPLLRAELLEKLKLSTSFGLGSETAGRDDAIMHSQAWDQTKLLKSLKPLAQRQLGSSGGGNHFADIMTVEFADGKQKIALVTHSGSRGTGKQVAEHYIALADLQASEHYKFPKGYGWFDFDSALGQEYYQAMLLMGEYARANHRIIHQTFASLIGEKRYVSYENHHNFAWIEGGAIVHRKGATPAHLGEYGIIPGSSGTNSYLVRGNGNPQSLNSASHGAGRVSSRSKAKEVFDKELFDIQMENITFAGVNPDEGFQAYKNVESVMAAQRELVDIVAVMKPRVVLMGGSSKTDDGD